MSEQTHLHDHPFKFYRLHDGGEERFYPHAGARLHFASRDTDTLSLPTLPVGTLAAGDRVKVTYSPDGQAALARTVFIGTVERIVSRAAGGSEQTETVTVCGPWSKMARLVYRQSWAAMGDFSLSSRLILNQTQDGVAQTLNAELAEIANHARIACGYAVDVTKISVSTQVLPPDECRDITVADAIRRELRLFPKAVARFDYSSGTPTLVIERKPDGSSSAAYLADVPKSERTVSRDGHPITGVDLEIESTGEVDGVSYRNIEHQTSGDTRAGNADCLYATLQVRGPSSSVTRQSFKSVTETIPTELNDVAWWKLKHPRLADVASNAITISEAKRTGSLPRIAASTVGEIEEAGLTAEVSKFTCKATIETADDKETDVYLTMHFVTTDAEGTAEKPKTYTWTTDSSSESGETVPAGLAAAILAERTGSLRSEEMTIRLGETFPTLGDALVDEGQTIFLQSVDVDCADLTADLAFGAPEFLSQEDMAALLSNFRNKCTTRLSSLRKTGKPEDAGGGTVDMGGITPLQSTEFQPGTKAKTTISSSGKGKIVLDSANLDSGKTISVHTVTVGDKQVKVLADQDFTSGGGSAGVESVNKQQGQLDVIGGVGIVVSTENKTIKVSLNADKKTEDLDPNKQEDPCAEHPSGGGETTEGEFLGGFDGIEPEHPEAGGGGCGGCGDGSTAGGESATGEPTAGAPGKEVSSEGVDKPNGQAASGGSPSGGSSGESGKPGTPGSNGKEAASGLFNGSTIPRTTMEDTMSRAHIALTDTKKMNQSPFVTNGTAHTMEKTVANTKTPIYNNTHAQLTDTKKMNESPFKRK